MNLGCSKRYELGARSWERGAWGYELGAGSEELGARSYEMGATSEELGAGSWELGNLQSVADLVKDSAKFCVLREYEPFVCQIAHSS